jgi:hypothetical protein
MEVMLRSVTQLVRSWSRHFKQVKEVMLIHEAAVIKEHWYDLQRTSLDPSTKLIQ